jgi:hypothetical protein
MILIDNTGLVAAQGVVAVLPSGMFECNGALFSPDMQLIDAAPPGPGMWRYTNGEFVAVVPEVPASTTRPRADVLADLASIDMRSIRALREGNAARIAELEAQAVALRAELAAL